MPTLLFTAAVRIANNSARPGIATYLCPKHPLGAARLRARVRLQRRCLMPVAHVFSTRHARARRSASVSTAKSLKVHAHAVVVVLHRRAYVSDATTSNRVGPSAVSTVSDLVQWGLRGAPLPARRALVLRVGAVLAFVALWSGAAGTVAVLHLFNPIFLAGPWRVFGTLWQFARDGQLWGHIFATLERVVLGFSLGALLAVGLGLPAGASRALGRVVEPIVELLRPIPPLAVLPLFIVWVGIGEASKVAFITYATFFPMFLATVHAVRHVDPKLVKEAKTEIK
jgi:ABC-type phosphate/phosphonate transport system permease subunit